jgi:hypothetical protein
LEAGLYAIRPTDGTPPIPLGRLIAQAPAMLDELREAVGWYDAQPREIRKPFYPQPGWVMAARAILRAVEEEPVTR